MTLIGGTGRSGTKWCAAVLRVAGYECGHEDTYPPRELDEWVIGFAEYEASCALPAYFEHIDYDRKVLVVRHPYSFAGSWVRNGPPTGIVEYVSERFGIRAFDPIRWALEYWEQWNRMGAEHADEIVRLEDLDADRLLAVCGLPWRWTPMPVPAVGESDAGSARGPWPPFATEMGYNR